MPEKTRNVAQRQAWVCIECAKKILNSSRAHQPADKALMQYFRENKQLGARDRRLIRSAIFAMFRWWGWVGQWEQEDWSKLLLLAYLLDNNSWNTVCEVWAQGSKLDVLAPDWEIPRGLKSKQSWIGQYTSAEAQNFSILSLVPNFIFPACTFPDDRDDSVFVEEFLTSLQKRSPLWIRVQSTDLKALQVQFEENKIVSIPHEKVAQAWELQGRVNIQELSLFKKGAFEIQDLASQCVGLICSPKPGEHWWDVCAGGGGKSLHLASLMLGKGQVLATEIRKFKLPEIRRRAKRGQFSNILIKHWYDHQSVGGKNFDGVLVDAPCSGIGRWRRDPDARWRISLQDIEKMKEQQEEILEYAKHQVKTGGVLVYATCSLLSIENEEIVAQFIEKNRDFQLESMIHPLTGEEVPGKLTFWPHDFNTDGIFVAKMRRE